MNGVPGLHGMDPKLMPPQNQPSIIKRFITPQALEARIDQWLEEENPPLINGLACVLEVDGRTMQKYLKGDVSGLTEEWTSPIKRAHREIAKGYEQTLRSQYTIGSIFALKNLGWTDERTQVLDIPDLRAAADAIRAGFGDLLAAVRESKQPERLLAQDKSNESG